MGFPAAKDIANTPIKIHGDGTPKNSILITISERAIVSICTQTVFLKIKDHVIPFCPCPINSKKPVFDSQKFISVAKKC